MIYALFSAAYSQYLNWADSCARCTFEMVKVISAIMPLQPRGGGGWRAKRRPEHHLRHARHTFLEICFVDPKYALVAFILHIICHLDPSFFWRFLHYSELCGCDTAISLSLPLSLALIAVFPEGKANMMSTHYGKVKTGTQLV